MHLMGSLLCFYLAQGDRADSLYPGLKKNNDEIGIEMGGRDIWLNK